MENHLKSRIQFLDNQDILYLILNLRLHEKKNPIRLEQRAQVISKTLPDQTEQYNIMVFCNKTKLIFLSSKII